MIDWLRRLLGRGASRDANRSAIEGDIDRVVREAFFSRRRRSSQPPYTMIEVGAARPDYLSIGGGLRPHGWRVVGIEPNPEFCAMHRTLGNEVIWCACGESDQNEVDFSVVDSKGAQYLGHSVTAESFSSLGLRGEYAKLVKTVDVSVREIKVPMRRLDTILAEHRPPIREIDLISVDVEGWELEVMRGLDFNIHRPKVLIIENLFNDQAYVDFFAARGYPLWRQLPPNEIYVRSDLMAGPCLGEIAAADRG
jgi:FkbM family methyltransferase